MSSTADHLETHGFAILPAILNADQRTAVEASCDGVQLEKAGTRNLLAFEWCRRLVAELVDHPAVSPLLKSCPRAVQCTLFEKSADRNWLVPYHQDLMIPVKQRVDDDRFTGWSEKEGTLYVQPPRDVLESLIALRVHIDDCGPTRGPLRVVPGSHRFGVLSNEQAAQLREAHGEHACTVERTGIVAMKPLVLHASSKASEPNRRRVLHILFGPKALPGGLEWNMP